MRCDVGNARVSGNVCVYAVAMVIGSTRWDGEDSENDSGFGTSDVENGVKVIRFIPLPKLITKMAEIFRSSVQFSSSVNHFL